MGALARARFTRWLASKAGRAAKAVPGSLGLEAAYLAGWRAATRHERKCQRKTQQLIVACMKKPVA
jgi:hypothetical protein